MPVIKGLEWTFDTVSELYEKYRPGYPNELYDMIFNYIGITDNSEVVEIGIGAGQATLPVLKTGCTLTSVEPGEHFCDLCRDKFKGYDRFSVIHNRFENVSFKNERYDLVYSASAFHWIPEEIGYSKVYCMLKHGSAFARFANHPNRDLGNPELSDLIDRLYDKYYCPFHGKNIQSDNEYSEEQAAERARIAEKYGFADIRYTLFRRQRVFTAEEYTGLLGTYSDHIALPEQIRTEFFRKIRDTIESHGNSFTIYDTIDLELARKP